MSSTRRTGVCTLAVLALAASACGGGGGGGGNESPPPAQTYTIGGAISGASSDGVLVTLGGAATGSVTTSGGGLFSFSALANGSYTLTPSKAGYTFSPSSITVTVNGANVTGQDFTCVAITYSVSGSVSGAIADGVLVTLTGGASPLTTTTAGGGLFSFTGVANGSYTLTPSRAGYAFSPASLAVTVNGGNVTGQSFTAAPLTYSVSGAVSGAIADGVLVTLNGPSTATATTAGGGLFSFSGLVNGSYTLTASRPGYAFSPASIAVTVNGASVTGRNFTSAALTYSVSGAVSGATADGVLMTLSGGPSTLTTTTAGGGLFSFSGITSGSYTLTPSKAGFTFSPASVSVTVDGANVTGQSFVAAPAAGATHSVSGAVSGAIADGVVVTLSGASNATTTTAGGGLFSFSGVVNGNYTLTASKAGYGFSPASIAVTVNGGNVTGRNFTSAALTYSVSGTVSGAIADGVLITLTGASSASATTAGGGLFTFPGLANGSYMVSASRPGYTFSPANLPVTVNGGNVTGLSFTATALTYSVSGTVSGAVADGVLLTLSGPSTVTTTSAGGGLFSFSGVVSGSYTLTASKAGYSFSPVSIAVTVNAGNVTGQDFVSAALTYSVSGAVSGAVADGVLMTLSGATTVTTTTAGGGLFSFQGVANGSYTLTPSKAGYTFSPASLAVTVNGGNLTGQSFTASVATYSVSGVVAGAVADGVVITLSGGADATTTTAGGGLFSFPGLVDGSYTLTPSKPGYSFVPPSISVHVSGGNVTGQNFTASSLSGYALSGAISGRWVSGITLTLTGGTTATTETSVGGAYGFSGLANGTYTVTPSLAGYTFSPPSRTVNVSYAGVTGLNFTASSAIQSYSISGNVTYPQGTFSGRIYLEAFQGGCSGCAPFGGTSIAGPGSYTIRGLQPGSYWIQARMDVSGHGQLNANDPSGASTSFNVSVGNVTGANVALVDAAPVTPVVPGGLAASPGDRAALVFWEVAGWPGTESATSYELSYGTDAAATNRGIFTVEARDDAHFIHSGLSNGDALYYKIRSRVGAAQSAWSAPVGPVTIGPAPGGNTVSGTVAFPGTATGPLYVAVQDQATNAFRLAAYATPASSPASFSISGVGNGPQRVFVILDQNGDHVIGDGDLANVMNGDGLLVDVSGDTSVSVTLNASNAFATTMTMHERPPVGPDWYQVVNEVRDGAKRAVSVTLFSGKNVPVPVDIGREWEFRLWSGTSAIPAVGDAYKFLVVYSDGTSEVLTSAVTAVLNSFAQNLQTNTSAPYSPSLPLFTWSAPASPPSAYGYNFQLWGGGANWWYPDGGSMPSTTLQIQYNVDGSASPPWLGSGTYSWSVSVRDANGNEARTQATYTVP